MQTKFKLLFIVALMLLGLTTATIINTSLNFREYSINSAVEKSKMAATIVKDGLTAHMVNGMMDKRQYFLDQISSNDDIKSLWLVRSDNVKKQYGEGFANETIRDAIDTKVLETGEMVQKVIEHTDKIYLRVSIPYKATITGTPNCLSCHDVKKGDTLGAISMEFDISAMRNTGLLTILKIFGINMLFLVIVLFLINHYIAPYIKLFSNMQNGIKKAYRGDFTYNFTSSVSGGDAQQVIKHLNTLFSKMQETFGTIKHDLSTFIPQGCTSSSDPLYEAKTIIGELSDIYKFKKTIELDSSKNLVYKRIIDILKIKYKIQHFALYEVNNQSAARTLIYISQGDSICLKHVDQDAMQCRAYRTKTDVISTEFINLCQSCDAKDLKYICIPFVINNDASLIISVTTKDDNEISAVNAHIPSIKNYLEAAKPVIESRILMDKLRDTSLRDGMTGLYNRRFLEEFIDQLMSQAQRLDQKYSVMMLDVDWFKMVNDTYGHDMGDKVIIEIASVLKDNIRGADLAIRYGGEEFVVLLHNASQEGTLKVAQKIHSAFGNLIFDVGEGKTMQKTMSIGIARFPTDGDSIWKCIKYADTALYRAKNTGRNKIVEFTADMFESEEF